jgi:DUF1009 family protein
VAGRLGVIAGSGPLPRAVVAAARAAGRDPFVLAIEGETEPLTVADTPHAWVALGAVGRALRLLREAGVREVCLIGPVRRPSLAGLRPDLRAARLLARLAGGPAGDDRLLRLIVEELEREGFEVVGADAVLAAANLPAGVRTRARPDAGAARDIALGLAVARRLGELDVGQAVVVQQGVVLGVEAIEGTDALLQRTAALRRPGPGGVLVKLLKPGQERRADLPTIGPRTIELAAAAGLQGIAVEAGGTLLVDAPATIAAADALGLFLEAVPRQP